MKDFQPTTAAPASPACTSSSRGSAPRAFSQWVQSVKGTGQELSKAGYQATGAAQRARARSPVFIRGCVALYDAILNQCVAHVLLSQPRPRIDIMPEHSALTSNLLGRLDWNAIPFHEPILLYTFIAVACGGIAILAAITYFRGWVPLWRDWITSIDHKKIGIMYIILGIVMLLRGFSDALMMRAQQALSFGDCAWVSCRRITMTRSSRPTA